MARPSSFPRWATDGGADIDEPPEAQKDDGWVENDTPPHGLVNWFWNLVYLWVIHLSGTASRFDTLKAAVEALAVGETGIVDETDMDALRGRTLDQAAPGATVSAIDVTGTHVVYSPDGLDPVLVALDALGVVIRTFTLTNAGTVVRVVTDGIFVVAAYGNFLECWLLADGVSQWDIDHGAAVSDCCIDATRAYLVGDAGTGTHHARATVLSSGASAWDYDHGGILESVCTDGSQVFIAGAASSFGSVANIRALAADNGFDKADEGGTGLDTSLRAWDDITATPISDRQRMATDGRHLYFIEGTTLHKASLSGTAGVVDAKTLINIGDFPIYVDRDFILQAGTDTVVWDKDSLAENFRLATTTASIASDGVAIYQGFSVAEPNELVRISRGRNRASVWRRIDPNDAPLGLDRYPYRQLIIPEE